MMVVGSSADGYDACVGERFALTNEAANLQELQGEDV
jgi:hypothetical protein